MASVFECVRCNALTYSASRSAVAACERCGSEKMRVLDEVNFRSAEDAARIPSRGDHCVALVADADDAARVACAFMEEGLVAGERVLSWLPPSVCDAIEQRLTTEQASRLRAVDASSVYARPFDSAVMIERIVEIAEEEPTALRIVGGPLGDPTAVAPAAEWERYEHLAHEVAVAHGIAALCLYEEPATPEDILAMVRRTHPIIERDEALRRNPDFVWASD